MTSPAACIPARFVHPFTHSSIHLCSRLFIRSSTPSTCLPTDFCLCVASGRLTLWSKLSCCSYHSNEPPFAAITHHNAVGACMYATGASGTPQSSLRYRFLHVSCVSNAMSHPALSHSALHTLVFDPPTQSVRGRRVGIHR